MREEFCFLLFTSGFDRKGECFKCRESDLPVLQLTEKMFGEGTHSDTVSICRNCLPAYINDVRRGIEQNLGMLMQACIDAPETD